MKMSIGNYCQVFELLLERGEHWFQMNTNLETRKIGPTVNHNTAIKQNLLR